MGMRLTVRVDAGRTIERAVTAPDALMPTLEATAMGRAAGLVG